MATDVLPAYCMARRPDSPWHCSKPRGHDSLEHIAYRDHDPAAEVLDRWTEPAPEIHLGAPRSIQRDPITNDLVLGWWVIDGGSTRDVAKVRIPPEEVAAFMGDLSREAWYAVERIGVAYAEGDCDVCGNTRTVDVVRNQRDWNVSCPACRKDKPRPVPFSNRPAIRRGTWDPTTPYDPDTMGG